MYTPQGTPILAKDFVAWFELSDILAHCFNQAGQIVAEPCLFWFAQPEHQAERPNGPRNMPGSMALREAART